MYSWYGETPDIGGSKNFHQNFIKCTFSISPASKVQYSSKNSFHVTTTLGLLMSRPAAVKIRLQMVSRTP